MIHHKLDQYWALSKPKVQVELKLPITNSTPALQERANVSIKGVPKRLQNSSSAI